jgi:hypothetical protein
MIPGFTQALVKMQRGGKYKVLIPAELATATRQAGEIPANTDLTFEIELLDFKQGRDRTAACDDAADAAAGQAQGRARRSAASADAGRPIPQKGEVRRCRVSFPVQI